jgi:hypothetical protein
VGEQDVGYVEVVLDEVALGDMEFLPEELVEVCELHYPIVDLDVEIVLVLRQFDVWD